MFVGIMRVSVDEYHVLTSPLAWSRCSCSESSERQAVLIQKKCTDRFTFPNSLVEKRDWNLKYSNYGYL